MSFQQNDRLSCPGCSSCLLEPFIRCAICESPNLNLCLHCFAKGYEQDSHQSNHDYEIITNDFPILSSAWKAKEEIALLDAVADCGIGNWNDVSNQVQSKSKDECEQHYINMYVKHARKPFPEFPKPPQVETQAFLPIPYRFCEDPPRPSKDSQKTTEMAGYMAARGDFSVEFDNYAEWDIKDIYFQEDDDQLLKDLKLGVIDIYRSRQKERHKRKKILREFGLINLNKQLMLERNNSKAGRELFEKMRPFMKMQSPEKHDLLVEGLVYEFDLQKEVRRLLDYRNNGITTFRGARLYEEMKQQRELRRIKRQHLSEVLAYGGDKGACQQWLTRQALLDAGHTQLPPVFPSASRKTAPPLDLKGMPGYEKLMESERGICASVRLMPEAYLEYKKILLTECNKHGFLKLKQARNLIKIDVNKTRKLYDFLIKQNVIIDS